jgi:uncharacterized protein (DUF58 family)
MTFPSVRLIWLAAFVLLPAGAAWAVPGFPAAPLLWLAAMAGLAAAGDAVLSKKALSGVEITVPEVLRLTRHEEGMLNITISRGERDRPGLVMGLDLPAGLKTSLQSYAPRFDGGHEAEMVSWPLTGTRRGHLEIAGISLRALSPLRLWHRQELRDCPAEIHVYPNLFKERKQLAAHFLSRGAIGTHSQRPVGKGREYEKLREYVRGDSPVDIHWKASARRGQLVTKEYQIERTQEIYVVIDSSRLSGRTGVHFTAPGQGEDPVLESYINSALLLGMVAQRQGDLFGLITFDSHIKDFLRARNGSAHFRACRDALYDLYPSSTNPDFGELSSFINTRMRKRALIFLLTSLDDPALAESFEKDMEVVNRRHLVMVNIMKPPHAAPLFTGEPVNSGSEIYSRLAGHLLHSDLQELKIKLKRRGIDMNTLERESVSTRLVSQYMDVKRRQLL